MPGNKVTLRREITLPVGSENKRRGLAACCFAAFKKPVTRFPRYIKSAAITVLKNIPTNKNSVVFEFMIASFFLLGRLSRCFAGGGFLAIFEKRLKASDSLGFRLIDVKDRQKFCYDHEVTNFLRQVKKF